MQTHAFCSIPYVRYVLHLQKGYQTMNKVALAYATFAQDAFVLPPAVSNLQVLMTDNTASLDNFAALVQSAPILSAQLLKIVNSPLYKFRTPVDSVLKAFHVLGTKAVCNLVIGYWVRTAFKDLNSHAIDLEQFWEFSVKTALFAQYWSQRLALHEPERFFTAALLHNIGELVVAHKTPEKAYLCNRFTIDEQPWERQQAVLGYTYKDITLQILKIWNLPESIIDCIKCIHDSPQTIGSIDSKVMQLAYHQALLESYPMFINDITELPEQYALSLGLNEQALEAAVENNRFRLISVASLFSSDA